MRLILPLIAAALVQAQQANLASFDEYKVSEIFKGKPAEPQLTTFLAHEYRSQIRDAAEKGPNFAGKFTIAQWAVAALAFRWS